jgi:hypothetical protein
VTYDVTAALNAIGICVFLADIYVEVGPVPGGCSDQHPITLCCRRCGQISSENVAFILK